MALRTGAAFSPTPAVKTMPSRPPSAAASEAMWRGDAIAKHLDRKARARLVAGQKLAEIRRNPGEPEHAGAAVEEVDQRVRRHPLLLDQVQHHTGIELAAAGAHRQPVERGEPHRRCDRDPASHRASRAAIAEMRYDHPAVGDLGRALRQHRGDVFVGKAVKAVAPYPLLVERVGQRKGLLDLRRGAVEGGVEARHLRQIRD